MADPALYSFMNHYITSDFEGLSVLRQINHELVRMLRHRSSHQPYICRQYRGSAASYRQLLGIRCVHLPAVYEPLRETNRRWFWRNLFQEIPCLRFSAEDPR